MWIGLLALLIHAAAALAQPAGRQPVKITAGDAPAAAYHMSRSSSGQLLWMPDGLTLVYWEGEDVMGDPQNPVASRIWLRRWRNETGWSERERVDRAPLDANAPVGGRHPAAVACVQGDFNPTLQLFVAWHDFRNCVSAGSWINNIEIYGTTRASGISFPETDLRLTQSASGTAGDNGYLPKLAVLPGGLSGSRLAMTWYDFTWNVNRSEICLWVSEEGGQFTWPGSMDSFRVTVEADRASDDMTFARQSFSVPTITADKDGLIHLVWSTGTDVLNSRLYYARYNPETLTWLEKRRLKPTPESADTEFINGGGYTDPAKLLADQFGGVYLLYTDYAVDSGNIMLRRRRAAATDFDLPVAIANTGVWERFADAAIDAAGRVHVVYVDEDGQDHPLRYKIYDPSSGGVSEQELPAFVGKARRPAIMLDNQGEAYIVWEEVIGDLEEQGDLWFWTTAPEPTHNAARQWGLYQ